MIFKKGMRVKYIKKCHDHDSFFPRGGLKLGNEYTISHVEGDNVRLNEAQWWVDIICVEVVEDSDYWYICSKIREMNQRRKEQGYAF